LTSLYPYAIEEFTVPGTKVAPFPLLLWGVFFAACAIFLFIIARLKGAVLAGQIQNKRED
jgi:hypothetical protein